MVKTGLINETIGLILCILGGFGVGLAFSKWGVDLEWPNHQMQSRGEAVGLIIGVAIACPSGIGAGLSLLVWFLPLWILPFHGNPSPPKKNTKGL